MVKKIGDMSKKEEVYKIMMASEQIIELLIKDTIGNKLHWYYDYDYFYCKIMTQNKNTTVHTIFKLSETVFPNSEFGYDDFVVNLDIYISKNKKNEIFCKRISDYQLKLVELLNAVLHVKKDKPKK